MNCSSLKILVLMILTAVILSSQPVSAEMKIILKNGKVVEVPVSKDEIKSIEYGVDEMKVKSEVFPEKAIRIQSAKYGNVSFELGNELGYKQYFCDAKEYLVEKCDGGNKCKVIVGSQICGDPYPGKGKYLYVEYSCGQKLKRAKNTQTEIMHLSCP